MPKERVAKKSRTHQDVQKQGESNITLYCTAYDL